MNDTELSVQVAEIDYERHSRKIIQDAIEDWDRYGEGCFTDWIRSYWQDSWEVLAALN